METASKDAPIEESSPIIDAMTHTTIAQKAAIKQQMPAAARVEKSQDSVDCAPTRFK
jgi:hypothetical protein